MDSIVVQVAEALEKIAYAGPFDTTAVVSRSYVARADLEEMNVLHVTIIPIAWQENDETRDTDSDVITCAMAWQYKVANPEATEQIDEVMRTFQLNTNRLRDMTGDDLDGLDAEMIEVEPGALYDTEQLATMGVVTSWTSVKVTVPRSRTR